MHHEVALVFVAGLGAFGWALHAVISFYFERKFQAEVLLHVRRLRFEQTESKVKMELQSVEIARLSLVKNEPIKVRLYHIDGGKAKRRGQGMSALFPHGEKGVEV
jgi:hypothetical protein